MSDEWKVGDTAYRAVISKIGNAEVIKGVVSSVEDRSVVWVDWKCWLQREAAKTPEDALWKLLRKLERATAAAERKARRIDRQAMDVAEKIAEMKAGKGE